MNRTSKISAILICLSLTLSSLPLPAFSAAALKIPAGRNAVPSSMATLPFNVMRAGAGSSALRSPAPGLGMGFRLSLTKTPMPAQIAPAAALPIVLDQAPRAAAAQPAAAALKAETPLPAGASLSAASPETASSERRSLVDRFKDAAGPELNSDRAFDNSRIPAPGAMLSILPQKIPKNMPPDLVLDQAPTAPDPRQHSGVSIESFDIPGAKGMGGIFSAAPTVLQADPASVADVERALRELVENDPVRYGIPSSELRTIHVKRVAGVGHQADTIYAYFHQRKGAFDMYGGYLSFTIKVLQGKPVIMAAMGQIYPNALVDTTVRFSDDELQQKALERLGPGAQAMGLDLKFAGKQIVYVNGAWHAASLYSVEGLPMPVMIAVDMATGEAFAWDPRAGVQAQEPAAQPASGQVLGRTTAKGPTKPDSSLAERPLPDINVTLGDGRVVTTDAEGKFTTASGLDALAAQFKAILSGKWAKVSNAAGGNLAVSGILENGKETTVTFNPQGMSEQAIAQVNGYLLTTLVHDWAKAHGLDDERLDQAIDVTVNIDDECNAYYTPGYPSLNFFKSSDNCVNSSYDTVVMHEYGHFIDDMLGGIFNGGLSEGWGDIFSMFILNNPIIGEGFLKIPQNGVDYIRTGENHYQYGEDDEVHDQGQAWGGFAWKLRQALIASLGEAAGAALASTLIIPTMLAKARDIPAAMAQVLLSDMDANGNMPHEAAIRAAAKAHGVTLPRSPGVIMTAHLLADWLASRPG
ncbi:MAG TPA: hypothetical protein DEB40_10210 [Elusimicrobia bacterium]|nr:hypothetical protein [Elusimicrobiota bacterium]HBT62102.1 hypothetical protein [Elusimicrobiota bacterium]